MERPIDRLLVANRGEIARRIFRSCAERGIETVAVYSDADAEAPFAREADLAVPLGGSLPGESYLRVDALIAAARRVEADAIHPGYGFLAESAEFARAVAEAGLLFVGPAPRTIATMGSKIAAREMMEAAGVPVLPGRTPAAGDDLAACGEEVGYPLLVKASAGGGGKGMRIVRDRADLEASVAAARREAASAFGDDAIFLERYVDGPRHVEIQIFGDRTGELVAMFERDCSVQRRHQKVIEESPSPALDADVRARMSEAAVIAGKALSYVGAGTVEFLLAPGGEFFFLEVNSRLQVEHPVTELVTGLDLVGLQLEVAEGHPLPAAAREPRLSGHAIEARLYAEDPEHEYLPVTGTVERIRFPAGVRVDTGVEDGSEITPFYDPMIAKVIARGATREDARRRLATALRRAEVQGLTTNRDFLVRVLDHPEFRAGTADTHFLLRHGGAELGAPLLGAAEERLCAAAAALAGQRLRTEAGGPWASFPSGWRNVVTEPQRVTYRGRHGEWLVEYAFDRGGAPARLSVDGENLEAPRLHPSEPGQVDLGAAGRRLRFTVRSGTTEGRVYVNTTLGQAELDEVPRFGQTGGAPADAGSLQAPMPGTVIRTAVEAGAEVRAGDPIMVLEAMKMEYEITAPGDGTVAELLVAIGDHVESGAVLAVLDAAD
jgi:acetyl/propionyl-CoA carboxylase alpha subunit